MAEQISPEKSIFLAAIEITSPSELAAFLERSCGANPELRAAVEALLAAHGKPQHLLDSPAVVPTTDEPNTGRPGTTIGPYKLLEQIGEGGMGSVWMAQQTEPVKRVVALKLIKAGMDSKQVIARFEAERQALALMDHPNIAKVLDAGTTSASRPYFVMDLVKGVPITRYCDEHRLTPRQRLELFIPVCHAVQHAHQKGIIHRDLKPSNVLVALYDARPVPKVIDFGVAKAAGQPLTDKTLVTGFGNIVGTLEYMSPEQAEFNQLDIDTRSDIYSLGVLLYELLAGSPPFSLKEMEKAGVLEMLRVIREQEPSRPSTKLSTADGLPTLAANRGTEPAKLARLVRGELDWIVMKALEKDRNRRYETANGFAMDVQRYLADEPVQACPPSPGYRLRKFVRKHKVGLAMAGIVAALLVFAVATLAFANVRVNDALAQKSEALNDKTAALTEKTKALDDLGVAQRETVTANEGLKKAFTALTEEQGKTRQAFAALTDEQNKTRQALDQERVALYSYRIALAHREWEAGRVGRAEFLLDECPEHLRGWEWHYLKRQCHLELVSFWPCGCWTAEWLGDGDRVAVASGGTLSVLNADEGTVITRRTFPDVRAMTGRIAVSKQERFAHTDGTTVFIKDLVSGKELSRVPVEDGQVYLLHEFSPDGEKLAWAVQPEGKKTADRFFQVWDVANNKALFRIPCGDHHCTFVEGGKALVHSQAEELVVRDSTSGKEQGRWHTGGVRRLVASQTDRYVATWNQFQ